MTASQIEVGPSHFAFLLSDGRLCRLPFSVISDRLDLNKTSQTSGGSGGSGNREKQMPVRPRSVNSALESKPIRGSSNINVSGGNKILGYATLGNDRTNNGTRSFHDNSLIGNGSSNYAR